LEKVFLIINTILDETMVGFEFDSIRNKSKTEANGKFLPSNLNPKQNGFFWAGMIVETKKY
jgi:hypothetical protein